MVIYLFVPYANAIQTNTDSLAKATIEALGVSPVQSLNMAKALYASDSTSTQNIYLLAKAYSLQANETMSDYYNALALQQDSLYLPALILKSEHELRGNDFAYAKGLVKKINTFFPTSASAHYLNAKVALTEKQMTEAILEANKALALDSNCKEAHVVLALAELKNGHFAEAAIHFENASSKIQNQPVYLNNYAVCLLETKQYTKASAVLQVASTLDSTNYFIYFNKGLAQYSSDQFVDAQLSFDRALRFADSLPMLHYLRAKCFIKQNKYDEARLDFQQYKKQSGDTASSREIFLFELSYWLSRNWYVLVALVVFLTIVGIAIRNRKR
jgi:Tfp pilus assembly protein PilF